MSSRALRLKNVLFLVGTSLYLAGCVAPRQGISGLHGSEMPPFALMKRLMNTRAITKGYGSAEIADKKERLHADFDFYSQGVVSSKLVLYSFAGNEVASLLFHLDSSTISVPGRVIRLASNEPINIPLFPALGNITAHDFIQMQSGLIPDALLGVPLLPVECSVRGSETTCKYADATKTRNVLFLLRSDRLKRIIFVYSENGHTFSIEQSSFVDGIPRSTVFKTDERSYYRITYKKIVTHRM